MGNIFKNHVSFAESKLGALFSPENIESAGYFRHRTTTLFMINAIEVEGDLPIL